MFRVFNRKRKRRLSSPRIIVLSVGAHLLLLGGLAVASTTPETEEVLTDIMDIGPVPVNPAPPADPPPPPPEPVRASQPEDAPQPVPGATVRLPAPTTVPTVIPDVDVNATPLTPEQTTGIGPEGDFHGTPPSVPTPPSGATTGGGSESGPDYYDPAMVEELPGLVNGAEMAQHFRRNYPPVLAAASVSGRVVLEFVVNPDGRVRPGSARVISASNPQFAGASLRVAERFRFRPARMGEQAVAVLVTIPIDWKPEQ